ncbi:MAG: decarboxylating NADP(+)-dependent phosphogluconate dehydrogenase [Planctomycetota bacterium]
MPEADIGLIGLAVMGQNLVLNMADHGFTVAVYNRTTSTMEDFVAGEARTKKINGHAELEDFVADLKRPRRVMIMVKAGGPVDAVIDGLLPLLDQGDIIIDGGNSHYADTERRTRELAEKGFLFLGTGVSGGEEGARFGPSIMPGGSPDGWEPVKPIFQAISAKVGPSNDIPCCDWVGRGGAGHYVKMVHNGIEYGDMQLICESYWLLKHALGLSNGEIRDVFAEWNSGKLDSYLIEITRDIFGAKDPEGDGDLVDKVLDKAGQKGTGKWTSQLALDLGVPTTLITEAVFARTLSAIKDERVAASPDLPGVSADPITPDRRDAFINDVRDALYASKIVSYAQGFAQLRAASEESGWDLDYGSTALLWRGGCIIRAVFLDKIHDAFRANPDLVNLMLDPFFTGEIAEAQAGWRRVVAHAAKSGIPTPAMSAALAYYDGYRSAVLPHNLLQAQRDYFGSHTYQRTDRQGTFHSEWASLSQDS